MRALHFIRPYSPCQAKATYITRTQQRDRQQTCYEPILSRIRSLCWTIFACVVAFIVCVFQALALSPLVKEAEPWLTPEQRQSRYRVAVFCVVNLPCLFALVWLALRVRFLAKHLRELGEQSEALLPMGSRHLYVWFLCQRRPTPQCLQWTKRCLLLCILVLVMADVLLFSLCALGDSASLKSIAANALLGVLSVELSAALYALVPFLAHGDILHGVAAVALWHVIANCTLLAWFKGGTVSLNTALAAQLVGNAICAAITRWMYFRHQTSRIVAIGECIRVLLCAVAGASVKFEHFLPGFASICLLNLVALLCLNLLMTCRHAALSNPPSVWSGTALSQYQRDELLAVQPACVRVLQATAV